MRRLPRARESVRMGAEMKFTNFIEDGIWLKGNLHTHTTNSDGELPPGAGLSAPTERGVISFSACLTTIFSQLILSSMKRINS